MITHRLTESDLLALATGPLSTELINKLRAAEISKHLILLEAVRRRLQSSMSQVHVPAAEHAAFEQVFASLARQERRASEAVRALLSRPQVGVWAVQSLRALAVGDRAALADLTKLMSSAAEAENGSPSPARLRIAVDDTTFDIVLDHSDPYLDLYGSRAGKPSPAELEAWRECLTGALGLLVRHDQATARALAAGLTTLVPLRDGVDQRSVSATSGWAFGAVALSLPPDHASCADNLLHEFRHVLLGAVADHFPLLDATMDRLAYAPWREDPRPLPNLLIGCHAYVGLLGFWHRQLPAETALAKITRWLDPTAAAMETLFSSGALTNEGELMVGVMREQLRRWRKGLGLDKKGRAGIDAAADHLIRWRLRHLRPDDSALRALVAAWDARARPREVSTRIETEPVYALPPGVRSRLLELRSGGYGKYPELSPDLADQAMLDGNYEVAAAAYKRRIERGFDPDAWAGLAVCRQRTRPSGPLSRQPEVVAGLHERLRARTRQPVDPDHLSAWLAGDHVITGSMSRLTRPR